jgi:hypothetical protein
LSRHVPFAADFEPPLGIAPLRRRRIEAHGSEVLLPRLRKSFGTPSPDVAERLVFALLAVSGLREGHAVGNSIDGSVRRILRASDALAAVGARVYETGHLTDGRQGSKVELRRALAAFWQVRHELTDARRKPEESADDEQPEIEEPAEASMR